MGTGEYRASFSAVKAAAYRISVTHGGVNIAGSPFNATVAPADISPSTSYAVGDGLQTAICGQKAWPSPCRKPRPAFEPLTP